MHPLSDSSSCGKEPQEDEATKILFGREKQRGVFDGIVRRRSF